MIEFNYETARAEINAMPCPPDQFAIRVSQRTMVCATEKLKILHFRGYTYEWSNFLGKDPLFVYSVEPSAKPKVTTQDILLARYAEHTRKVYS